MFLRPIKQRALAGLLLCAVLALFIPAPSQGAVARPSCCAHMKAEAQSEGDCPMHQQAPADKKDPSCCQACATGLTLLFVAPPDFVYAPTGEVSLVSLSTRGHSLPHRPPVPPPR